MKFTASELGSTPYGFASSFFERNDKLLPFPQPISTILLISFLNGSNHLTINSRSFILSFKFFCCLLKKHLPPFYKKNLC